MSRSPLFRFILSLLVITLVTQAAGAVRETLNFNRDWKFQLGNPNGAEAVAYADTAWQSVGLPHTFSLPYFLSPDFYVGYGWYRKTFDIPAAWSDKRISLEFEAAFQDAEIWINGRKVGTHQGGYTGFPVDITAAVQPGRNIVAVRLNNLWNARLAPRAGEHVFSGGLYRNVWLVATDPLHVAWYGTFVTSPKVSADSATVNVKTEVRNDSATSHNVELKTALLDPEGQVVALLTAKQSIPAGTTVTFDQTSPALPSPKLWHPDHPHLYRAVSQLTDLDRRSETDRYETTFGIRWFEWTADRGFFLNGQHLYLHGANIHQDQAGWGDAVTDSAQRRDIQMIKDAGFLIARGSHYPAAPARSLACDELGVLLWSENAFWGIGGFRPDGYWNCSAYPVAAEDEKPFEESVKASLRAMIRIHRNHPSIVTWSMGNETFFSASAQMPKVRAFLKDLVALTHELDPTRPAAIGGVQRPLDAGRLDKIGDIAGYNGDGASVPAFQNPGVPNLVAEYGSVTADRPGNYAPGWADLAKDNGQPVHPWRSGQIIWCAFDHGSIAGAKLGKMGIVDYFRIPKRSYYWYRDAYGKVPPPAWPERGTPARLQLAASSVSGIRTDGTDDVQLTVTVLDATGKPTSNSPPVELAIVSGPGEFPTGPSIRFEEKSDIRILDGQAAIALRSYYAGTTIVRATSPGLTSADLTLSFEGAEPYVAGRTPATPARPYVRFDKKGQPNIAATYGLNNPTFASSTAPGLSAGLATDGKRDTSWKPAPDDATPSLTLDTEKGLAISSIQLDFAEKQIHRFRVETSTDRSKWTLVADLTANSESKNAWEFRPPAGTTGRYVRVTFADAATASLAEIRVTGLITN
ncbi:MAG TPA: glycoside hydrolase family 2 TIM barrel-domain containing protein [Rariglobus sp.]|nr:glycoside hydrolase family 2 TIM barrel-domain containing protein [Rariglobus sp.]